MKVLLAHTPEMRRNYYGERSLSGLRAAADVILHESDETLDAESDMQTGEDGIITAPATDEAFMREYIKEWKRLMKASPNLVVQREP